MVCVGDKLVDPWEIESFPELDTRKKYVRKLVDDFHEEGLVHGDLRPEIFIFTESSPPRTIIVDFDWGGKEGEVRFPLTTFFQPNKRKTRRRKSPHPAKGNTKE